MDFRRNLKPVASLSRVAPARWTPALASLLLSAPAFASGGGVVIDIDATIVIQFALLIVLWFTLNKLVFQPYLATSQARQAKTDDTRVEATRLRARVEALRVEHKARWSAARDEADAARAALRDAGAGEREQQVSAARAQSRKIVEDGHVRVEAQLKAAHAEVGARTAEIAQAVVDKILGRGL